MTVSPYLTDVKVEVAFNAGYSTPAASRTWTDVSTYLELAEGIGIQRGRQDELGTVDASTLSLTLDNKDGRFTPDRTGSPYYPNVKLNRPIRVTATTIGNLVVNSTFEVDTATWSIALGTIARVTTQFWQGAASLQINWPTVAAAGETVFCTPTGLTIGQTYTYSAYVRTPSGTPRVRLIGGGTSPGTSPASSVSTSWQRLSATFVAEATSHNMQVVNVDATTAGQTSHVDGVMLNVGAAAPDWTSQAPVASTRFTGYVDEWPVEWDGTDAYAKSTVTATSRLARLGNAAALSNIIAEEYRRDSPAAHYMMNNRNDATGKQSPLLRTFSNSGTGTAVNFTNATGPGTDGITAATFAGGEWLVKRWEPVNASSPTGTVEFFLLTSTANKTVLGAPDETSSSTGRVYYVEIGSDGKLIVGQSLGTTGGAAWSQPSTNSVADGLTRHIAIVCDGSSTKLYINGALDVSNANNWAGFNKILSVGGSATYDIQGGAGFIPRGAMSGVIAHLAVYDYALTAGRIFDHAAAGLSGFAGEAPWLRTGRYAIYAGVPAAENNFDVDASPAIAHVDTTDQSALDLMQRVAATAGSLFFDARDGNLRYLTRSNRYDATAAFTLDMGKQQVEAGVTPKYDDQTLINDFTATLIGDDGLAVRAVDQASVDDHGPRAESLELLTADARFAADVAWWNVNTYKQPRARVPDLSFDLLTLDAATQAAVMAADIGSMFTVTNWPSQAAKTTASFFIEGYTETIGPHSHTFSLNVSPGEIWLETFKVGDNPRGTLDSIYRIAY